MKKGVISAIVILLSLTVAANDYDQDKPFGFCTRASRSDANSTYNITGGGCYTYPVPADFSGRVTILTSEGPDVDMKNKLQNSLKNNEVVILDGSKGDFFVSRNVVNTYSNRTLIGINNARLCTMWKMTEEIRSKLDAAGVPQMRTNRGTGSTLANGQKVGEEAEYNTRKIIMEMTGDQSESYRGSGVLTLKNCQNIIVRNISFVGPGSVDVGGSDLLTCNNAKNCWIDHCAFTDGMDGNFDITVSSDFITVSWCTFSYTDRSYMHQNTNLVGYSDREPDGFLNTTFAFNWWGTGCHQRMPMVRRGKIHMLNNYYSCTTASNCINPRIKSEFLIEGNYFEKGVKRYYSQNDAMAVTWADSNHAEESNKAGKPTSIGTPVTVPYDYSVAPYSDVPSVVKTKAGATLFSR